MPRRYPPELRRQVVELVRSGTRVAVLADTFGMSEVTIYNWLKQDRIDRGEELGKTTDQQLELAAAKRRIRQVSDEAGEVHQTGTSGLGRMLGTTVLSWRSRRSISSRYKLARNPLIAGRGSHNA